MYMLSRRPEAGRVFEILPDLGEVLMAADPASPMYDGLHLDRVVVHNLPPGVIARISDGTLDPFSQVLQPDETTPGKFIVSELFTTAFATGVVSNKETGQAHHFRINGLVVLDERSAL